MNPDCKACVILSKIYGPDFEGCHQISKEMAKSALDLMKDDVQKRKDNAKLAFDSGKITKEEFDFVSGSLDTAIVYAASGMPMLVMAEGARISPQNMMSLVLEHISNMTGADAKIVQVDGKTGLQDLIAKLGPDGAVKMLKTLAQSAGLDIPVPTGTPKSPKVIN